MEKLFSDQLLLDNPKEAIEKMNKELERAQESGRLVNFMTVPATELGNYPNCRVVHIYQEIHESTGFHQDYTSNTCFPTPMKTVSTYAIIARTASEVLEDLMYTMKSYVSGKEVAERNLKTAEQELSKVSTKVASLEKDLENARKHTLDYSNEAKEAWGRLSRYEKDINKLRNALGEIRMNEILGEER